MRVVCSSPGGELPSGVLLEHIGLEAPEPFQGSEDVVVGSALPCPAPGGPRERTPLTRTLSHVPTACPARAHVMC